MTLENKVALVTGARGGIGRAIVSRFLNEGARVYSCDLNQQGSMETLSEKNKDRFIQLDVRSQNSVEDAFKIVKKECGKLDVLVNAAGVEIEKTIEETTLQEWEQSFAVNSTGTFLTSKYALPLLRKGVGDTSVGDTSAGDTSAESARASIINFGSYDGFIADPQLAAYCATKGAVHALTKAMACDHGPEGIRVNAICPGYIDTPMLQSFFEGGAANGGDINSLKKAVRDVHPIRDYGKPEDVANLAYWLASDESRYASGQLWILDGGLSAQVQQMKL